MLRQEKCVLSRRIITQLKGCSVSKLAEAESVKAKLVKGEVE
jgi:hypothetical protein